MRKAQTPGMNQAGTSMSRRCGPGEGRNSKGEIVKKQKPQNVSPISAAESDTESSKRVELTDKEGGIHPSIFSPDITCEDSMLNTEWGVSLDQLINQYDLSILETKTPDFNPEEMRVLEQWVNTFNSNTQQNHPTKLVLGTNAKWMANYLINLEASKPPMSPTCPVEEAGQGPDKAFLEHCEVLLVNLKTKTITSQADTRLAAAQFAKLTSLTAKTELNSWAHGHLKGIYDTLSLQPTCHNTEPLLLCTDIPEKDLRLLTIMPKTKFNDVYGQFASEAYTNEKISNPTVNCISQQGPVVTNRPNVFRINPDATLTPLSNADLWTSEQRFGFPIAKKIVDHYDSLKNAGYRIARRDEYPESLDQRRPSEASEYHRQVLVTRGLDRKVFFYKDNGNFLGCGVESQFAKEFNKKEVRDVENQQDYTDNDFSVKKSHDGKELSLNDLRYEHRWNLIKFLWVITLLAGMLLLVAFRDDLKN